MSKRLGPDGFHVNAIATTVGTKPIVQVAGRYVLATWTSQASRLRPDRRSAAGSVAPNR